MQIPAGGPRASPTPSRKSFLKAVGEGLKVNCPAGAREATLGCAPPAGRSGTFGYLRRGGYQPPASLPPSRGKVPPKGADEGALLKRRLLSLPVLPLPPKPPLSKGGAAKRRGDSLSQRTFKVRLFFSVGAHTVRPRAAEVVGPYEKTGRFPKFCRGGCPHPPVPEDVSLSVGAAFGRPQAFPLLGGRCREQRGG